jgi:hypothetical protein
MCHPIGEIIKCPKQFSDRLAHCLMRGNVPNVDVSLLIFDRVGEK